MKYEILIDKPAQKFIVIYTVNNEQLVVRVINAGNRGDIYKQ